MLDDCDVSVVLSTYNRCELLPKALTHLLSQRSNELRYEVLVVDNNSTDQTREVVESWIAKGHGNLRYVFEGSQGVSHARNAGIAVARAPIIAFTDDDVYVAEDWLGRIVAALRTHPEADYVGGKALAIPDTPFPPWLDRNHWSPLALFDYGDAELAVNASNPICLGSGNSAFRREVFGRIQPFSPDFARSEDHELQTRLWKTGGQGVYVPELVVFTEIPFERLTKRYHRRWHRTHGFFIAKMRLEEVERSSFRLFDVPGHLFRQAGSDVVTLIVQTILRHPNRAFLAESRLQFLLGYLRQRSGRGRRKDAWASP